jgi:hypothetical protein
VTEEPSTYGKLHAGDLVRGSDGEVWGVEGIVHVPALAVTLVRGQHRVTGYPPVTAAVMVVQQADISAEWAAAQTLIDGLGAVEILGEKWEAL